MTSVFNSNDEDEVAPMMDMDSEDDVAEMDAQFGDEQPQQQQGGL